MQMDEYKNNMKKIQEVLDPIRKEKEFYDDMMRSLTKSTAVAIKAINSITSTIAFTNPEIDATRSMTKALTASLKCYQSLNSTVLNNMMQKSITDSLSGLTEAIKSIQNFNGNLKNVIIPTNISKLMEETFSLKPIVEEFARISSLSLNSDNSKSINFEKFNSDTAIDYINNDNDLNKNIAKPIIEMVNNNQEIFDIAIEAYKKGLDDGQDLRQSTKIVSKFDILNAILTFISIIVSIYCTFCSQSQTIEIHNNYYNTEELESGEEQTEKVLPKIEQSKQK